MPYRPASPCSRSGCPQRAVRRGLCERHAAEAAARYREQHADARPSAAARGYDQHWRRIRAQFLRKHPVCVDCGQPASEVDHNTSLAQGGTNEWSNLRARCKPCHSRKTATQDGGFGNRRGASRPRQEIGRSMIPVTIVAGPPGGGKSSYVAEHKLWGDLVVDMDALYHALTGLPWYDKPDALLPFVAAARDAVITRLARASNVRHAWIITGQSDLFELVALKDRLGAKQLVMLETSPTECLRRIAQDPRRAERHEHWQELVRHWWETYQATKAQHARATA